MSHELDVCKHCKNTRRSHTGHFKFCPLTGAEFQEFEKCEDDKKEKLQLEVDKLEGMLHRVLTMLEDGRGKLCAYPVFDDDLQDWLLDYRKKNKQSDAKKLFYEQTGEMQDALVKLVHLLGKDERTIADDKRIVESFKETMRKNGARAEMTDEEKYNDLVKIKRLLTNPRLALQNIHGCTACNLTKQLKDLDDILKITNQILENVRK